MSDREPAPHLPTGQEILTKLRNSESELHQLKPKVTSIDTLENNLIPVDLSHMEVSRRARKQLDHLNQLYETKLFRDPDGKYLLKITDQVKPENPVSTYISFRELPFSPPTEGSLNIEAEDILFAADGQAVSVQSLLPTDQHWTLRFESIIESDGYINNFRIHSLPNIIFVGLTLDTHDASSLLHEVGHVWARLLELDPDSEFQGNIRAEDFYKRKKLTPDELSGIQEVSHSERLANLVARHLIHKLAQENFTISGESSWIDNLINQRDLERSYDEPIARLVSKTANPQQYYASRKYRTKK